MKTAEEIRKITNSAAARISENKRKVIEQFVEENVMPEIESAADAGEDSAPFFVPNEYEIDDVISYLKENGYGAGYDHFRNYGTVCW